MKKSFFYFIACALATPAALLSADFEGSVYFKINTGKGSPQDINYSAKNGLVRIDIKKTEGRSPSVILDAAKKEMIVLLPEQKKYMVQAIAESRNPLDRPGSPEPTLEKIDGTEKIIELRLRTLRCKKQILHHPAVAHRTARRLRRLRHGHGQQIQRAVVVTFADVAARAGRSPRPRERLQPEFVGKSRRRQKSLPAPRHHHQY